MKYEKTKQKRYRKNGDREKRDIEKKGSGEKR